jgi:hypothetical protein
MSKQPSSGSARGRGGPSSSSRNAGARGQAMQPAGARSRQQAAPQPEMDVRLRILNGPGAGTEYAIAGAVVRLGRGEENDIVLDDNNASRVHAEVVRDKKGRFLVRDLDSRNGIFVNRKKVPQAPLAPGDKITIGGTSVEFVRAGAGGGAAAGSSGALGRWLLVAVLVGGIGFVVVLVGSGSNPGGGGAVSMVGTSNVPPIPGGDGLGSGVNGKNPQNVASPPPGSVSLTSLFAPPTGGGKGTPGGNGVDIGRNATTRTTPTPGVPISAGTPVAAAEISSILGEGDRAMSSYKLVDARAYYARAVKLDPTCERCRSKLDKVEANIKQEIDSSLSAGMSYLNTERYPEAQNAFEKVKLLDPDPTSINNGNATRYIEEVKRKMLEQAR